MIKQTPGKIFLADQRGLTETSRFRRYSTFNFGSYAHEHKAAFGRLQAVNEETLGGGQHLVFRADQDTHLLLIPVTGELLVSMPAQQNIVVEVETMHLLTVPAGATITLQNPYAAELVTFLHLWVQPDAPVITIDSQQYAFRLSGSSGQLTRATAPQPAARLPFSVHLGQFAGRQETVYKLPPGASFFAYVLAGAFETEGRLLHEKDSLALWETDEVELEALSNNALLLVLELKA
jgi:redox-sensitive bicupin YhaK (pirin superfamily)